MNTTVFFNIFINGSFVKIQQFSYQKNNDDLNQMNELIIVYRASCKNTLFISNFCKMLPQMQFYCVTAHAKIKYS
ncbi:MAG TPA: hypothetical protein DDY71_06560 [Spirochaetia bacterium]|nr:hypothetical protein [Spirochaetia bacterium]